MKEKPSKVLIVDDEKSIRSTLSEFLANNGYQTYSASTNAQALMCLKKENIDIVITDISHPGLDGLQLTRRVKASYNADVIVLSGTIPQFNTPKECYDAGACAVSKKPAKLVDILDTVKSILKKRREFLWMAEKQYEGIKIQQRVKFESREFKQIYIGKKINQLRAESKFVHSAFLTFLIDKCFDTQGNFTVSNIVQFMGSFNLRMPSGEFRNPWMMEPYGGKRNGLLSCQHTIEHFKQTRKFGCWCGKDIKTDCEAKDYCIYHPYHPNEMKNKCDLRNGVIWKRNNPDSQFDYGAYYIDVIKNELLKNEKMPLKPLLAIFYLGNEFQDDLIGRFIFEFNLKNEELPLFSVNDSSPSPSSALWL